MTDVFIRTPTGWEPLGGGGGGDGVATPSEVWGLHWKGIWKTIDTYIEDDVVSHMGEYWIASEDIVAGIEPQPPGEPPVEMLTNTHMATSDPHTWLGTEFKSWSSSSNVTPNDYAWFYFDVITGGTITVDQEGATSPNLYLYNADGSYIGTSTSDYTATVAVGRNKLGITKSGGASGTVRLVPGTAVLAPLEANPWQQTWLPPGPEGEWDTHWKGEWSATATYVTDDVVLYDGDFWIALKASAAGTVPGGAEPPISTVTLDGGVGVRTNIARYSGPFAATGAYLELRFVELTAPGSISLATTVDPTCTKAIWYADGSSGTFSSADPYVRSGLPAGKYIITLNKGGGIYPILTATPGGGASFAPPDATWQETELSPPTAGGTGGGEYYEQAEEPEDASQGAFWLDTDAVPSGGNGGTSEPLVETDPLSMKWKDVWVSNTPYKANDIVTQGGFAWLALADIAATTVNPTVSQPGTVTVPSWGTTAKPIGMGTTSFPAQGTQWWYIDVVTAGTITISNNYTPQPRNAVYKDPDLGSTVAYNSSGDATWSATPGRYFFSTSDFGGASTGTAVTLTGTAVFAAGSSWRKMWAVPA